MIDRSPRKLSLIVRFRPHSLPQRSRPFSLPVQVRVLSWHPLFEADATVSRFTVQCTHCYTPSDADREMSLARRSAKKFRMFSSDFLTQVLSLRSITGGQSAVDESGSLRFEWRMSSTSGLEIGNLLDPKIVINNFGQQ